MHARRLRRENKKEKKEYQARGKVEENKKFMPGARERRRSGDDGEKHEDSLKRVVMCLVSNSPKISPRSSNAQKSLSTH